MSVADLRELVKQHDGHSRRVIEYALTTKVLVDNAKGSNSSAQDWDPLRELVAPDEFVRVGNFKETMDWDEYVAFLTNWASAAQWDCAFRRITETNGLVFLELEEFSAVGDYRSAVNSLSVYEFNDADKIRRIDVYLQMAMPAPQLLESYDGVSISDSPR